ncbi:type II secretion system GspH family protein [bacterium]|nr:type II secretion system GspH family protein [bacterium]
MKKQSNGFSLVEIVIAAAIATGVTAWATPRYFRALRQAEVDRYTQSIEAGFFNLRADLGTSRTSCQLKFDQAKTWVKPQELLEFRQDNGKLANTKRLRCCNSQIEKANKNESRDDECHDGPLIGALLNKSTASEKGSMRFIRTEGSNEVKKVEVAVSRTEYELTPPGTSARTEPITFMVRSIDAVENTRLISRCVQVSGNGHLLNGTWEGSLSTGKCKTKGE